MHLRSTQQTLVIHALIILLGALPAVWLWSLVQRYGVEVPLMDDWEMAEVIAKAHSGQLAWRDFVKQEEEARMIVPKLVFIASAADGHWDVRRLMKLSVFVCAATAAGLFYLLRRAQLPRVALGIAFMASALLIFSPTQFELWLFASGLPSFLPPLFLVAALVMYQTRLPPGVQFAGSALLAAMSSFTLPHGLLAWGLTFPVYLLGSPPPRWRRWAAAWVVVIALGVILYFSGYRRPPHLPEFAPVISAGQYLTFFLAFLGNSFAYANLPRRVELAAFAGAITFLLFLASVIYASRRRSDRTFLKLTLPWFALAIYAMGAAALAALGRVALGLDWAVSSRYVTFGLYLPVAVAALLAIIWADLKRNAAYGIVRPAYAISCFALLGVGLGLWQACITPSLHFMESGWARNRLARGALSFCRVLDVSALIRQINYPHPPTALGRGLALDDRRLLRPPYLRTTDIGQLPHGNAGGRAASGYCDAIGAVDAEHYRASGWATLNAKQRPADCVVLAYDNGDGNWKAFTVSDAVTPRADIVQHLGARRQLWSGWTATFPRAAVPPNARISAWAFDAQSTKLFRLKQNAPELTL